VASRSGVGFEVLVLDDSSTDGTAGVVREIALRDARVRLVEARALPRDGMGSSMLAGSGATVDGSLMLFLDADVRIVPDAVVRCVEEMRARKVALLSGFPRQIMNGWMERMLLPLIHFVLLGLLPMGRMRKSTKAAYAAGAGSFFWQNARLTCLWGHAAIRDTRHDGLRLPEEFRSMG